MIPSLFSESRLGALVWYSSLSSSPTIVSLPRLVAAGFFGMPVLIDIARLSSKSLNSAGNTRGLHPLMLNSVRVSPLLIEYLDKIFGLLLEVSCLG